MDLKNRPVVQAHFATPVTIKQVTLTSVALTLDRPKIASIEESPKGVIVVTIPRAPGETPKVVLVPWSNVTDVLYGEPA